MIKLDPIIWEPCRDERDMMRKIKKHDLFQYGEPIHSNLWKAFYSLFKCDECGSMFDLYIWPCGEHYHIMCSECRGQATTTIQ